jgi:AraC-like DNA-binding protein
MAPMRGTMPATVTSFLVEVATRVGLAREDLVAHAGIAEAALADPDGRVPFEQHMRIWDRIAASEGVGAFGLRLGSLLQPQNLGVVGYAALHAPNVQEAYARITRFRRLVNDMLVPELSRGAGRVVLRHVFTPDVVRLRHPAEASLSGALALLRGATGIEWVPLEVSFQHPAPADTAPHREVFRAPIHFSAADTRMVLADAVLESPHLAPDPRLGAYLSRHAEGLLARLPAVTGLAPQVQRLLADELRGGDPSQDRIAKKLGMSTRTLQRRLRDEGSTFVDIVDGLRRELSQIYLGDPKLTVYEVAFLLGFTDTSAFFRAFRRWTGRTPRAFRLQLGGAATADGRAAAAARGPS